MSGYLEGAVQRLLGCDWGHLISLEYDREKCSKRDVQRIQLHKGEDDLALVQLCADHLRVVDELTNPHEQIKGGNP